MSKEDEQENQVPRRYGRPTAFEVFMGDTRRLNDAQYKARRAEWRALVEADGVIWRAMQKAACPPPTPSPLPPTAPAASGLFDMSGGDADVKARKARWTYRPNRLEPPSP